MLNKKDRDKVLKTLKQCRTSTPEDVERVSRVLTRKTSSVFDEGKILKTSEVADMLGIATYTVRELANSGILKVHYGMGKKRWSGIMRDSVDRYLNSSRFHKRVKR